MDDVHVEEPHQPPEECIDKNCINSDTLDESTVRVEELKQQIQYWRQKHNECTKQVKELDNLLHQTRRIFSKQLDDSDKKSELLEIKIKTIKREEDTLLLEERKKQDQIKLKEDELAASLETTDKLKQQIQLQKDTINDLQRNIEVAKGKIDKNSSLLKDAEARIKLCEEQLIDTRTSNLTSSAGVSPSEIQNGCQACVEITEEVNALKGKNSELIKDLEQINLQNTKLTAENIALQNKLKLKNQNTLEQDKDKLMDSLKCEKEELKKQNQQLKHTVNDLKHQLKEAKCEIDKKSRLHKDLSEELNALRIQNSRITRDLKKTKFKMTDELNAVKLQLKQATRVRISEKSLTNLRNEARIRIYKKQLSNNFNLMFTISETGTLKLRRGHRGEKMKSKLMQRSSIARYYQRRGLSLRRQRGATL